MRADQSEEVEALRDRIRDLESALCQRNESLSNTFKLTPALNNMLGLLLSLPTVKSEVIHQRLGIASDAKVAMHRLRKELEAFGIEVHSKRLLGYWLDDETKARIKTMIAPLQEVSAVAPASEAASHVSA